MDYPDELHVEACEAEAQLALLNIEIIILNLHSKNPTMPPGNEGKQFHGFTSMINKSDSR